MVLPSMVNNWDLSCFLIRVGDTIRFGNSSRLYVLGGPDELRPEEGLTASAKAKLAALEHVAHMKERDKEVGRGEGWREGPGVQG
jgi:hypothetical protein